jgi:uracil-DNA glycosylase
MQSSLDDRSIRLKELLTEVRACQVCAAKLPFEPRPLLQAEETARILVVGQAPGIRAHQSRLTWNDLSGERLRTWMGIDRKIFYDASRIAIIPMGYCYPGKSKGGDLPPRRECAQLWLDRLLAQLPHIELTLLIGHYAQQHYLKDRCHKTLTETVKNWKEYDPRYIPLPHPSPRNLAWFKRNPWLEQELLPALRVRIAYLLGLCNST